MAFIAPENKMAVPVTTQAPPAVIVVTQNVISPIGQDPATTGGGTQGYVSVGG